MADSSLPANANANAGSAMQRAVVAEQDAREAIARAEAEAAAAVETARAEARAILNAVPDRITKLRARGTRAVERALESIRAEEAAALRALGESAFPAGLLDSTTHTLAARLTGGITEPPR